MNTTTVNGEVFTDSMSSIEEIITGIFGTNYRKKDDDNYYIESADKSLHIYFYDIIESKKCFLITGSFFTDVHQSKNELQRWADKLTEHRIEFSIEYHAEVELGQTPATIHKINSERY